MEKTIADKAKTSYLYEINFMRAIASLSVVMVHVSAGFYNQAGQVHNWFTFFLNQISRFGTPAFAIISGFLLFYQVKKRGFHFGKFVKSRTTKIVFPFLFWSVFYLYLLKFYGLYELPPLTTKREIYDFIYYFFSGKSFYHLYFIALVVQFYLLFPFIQMVRSKAGMWLLALGGIAATIFMAKASPQVDSYFIQNFINDRVFLLYWIAFFLIGGLLAYYWKAIFLWVERHAWFSVLLGLAVVAGGVVEYSLLGTIPSNRLTNIINMPILLMGTVGVYVLLGKWESFRRKVIEVGNLSMGIYLVHPLVLFISQQYWPFMYKSSVLLPIIYAAVVAASIGIVKAIQLLPYSQYIVTVAAPKGGSSGKVKPSGRTVSA